MAQPAPALLDSKPNGFTSAAVFQTSELLVQTYRHRKPSPGYVPKRQADPHELAVDEDGAGEKLCQVRAYLKTQGKVIIEVAAKDLIGILLRNMESAFEVVVDMTNAEKFAHLVVEPRQVERKREVLEVTLKGLNKAKSFLQPLG